MAWWCIKYWLGCRWLVCPTWESNLHSCDLSTLDLWQISRKYQWNMKKEISREYQKKMSRTYQKENIKFELRPENYKYEKPFLCLLYGVMMRQTLTWLVCPGWDSNLHSSSHKSHNLLSASSKQTNKETNTDTNADTNTGTNTDTNADTNTVMWQWLEDMPAMGVWYKYRHKYIHKYRHKYRYKYTFKCKHKYR